MTKIQHDELSAVNRVINYQKEWYVQGIAVLERLNRRHFSMLDLGCGNGEFAEMARDRFGAVVTCLDYAGPHLEKVQAMGFSTIHCDFDREQDVQRLRREYEKTFDIIVSFEVIEHIFDVDAFLANAHHMLKPGGLLLISTPNVAYAAYRVYAMFRDNLPVCEGHHVRFFSRRRLAQTLVLDGFDVLSDCCFGRGSYYLDRAVGENQRNFRAFAIKALFYLWYFIARKSWSSYYSGLMLLARKAPRKPIGLDPAFRKHADDLMRIEDQRQVMAKIWPLRKQGFFDEHPMLMAFIDAQAALLGKDVK